MFIGVAIVTFMSCSHADGSHMSVREAQKVVVQADSLWHNGQMYGVDEGDSATLAQAYEILKDHSVFSTLVLGTSSRGTYSHACYHYGKLLRAKDDPAAAMQAFINATHSHTRDYHILGRVYSNMGDICHLGGEYQLSYDMFEKSADMFLRNGDTLLYYYDLNNMAFEKAIATEKDSAYTILSKIEECCSDSSILLKILETKAEACLYKQQYDSVLYYSNLLSMHGYSEPMIYLLRAKTYSFMGQRDSAAYYAHNILLMSDELYNKNSALYILTHCDDSIDIEGVRTLSSNRSDTQKLIEIRQGKLSQAIQLLEQDMSAKPDRRWILSLISFILFSGVLIFVIYIWKKRKQHQHILQDIQIKEEQQTRLVHEIDSLSHIQQVHHDEIIANMELFCQLCENDKYYYEHLHWNNYAEMCEIVNRYLYNVIARLEPYNLSEKETRLCVLVLLKATTDQMVNLIPYSHSGLGKFKYTIARKLGTKTAQMRPFILELLG